MLRTMETMARASSSCPNHIDLAPIADPYHVSGFQSPADDYKQDRLDITEKLVRDPLNTFFFESDSEGTF